MRGEFQEALRRVHSAEENILERGRQSSKLYGMILLNISKSYYELENFDKATEYFAKATDIQPDYEQQFGHLRSSETSGARSSNVSRRGGTLFSGDGK